MSSSSSSSRTASVAAARTCDLEGRFDISPFSGDPGYDELCALLKNGLYYQATGNAIGALTSYSMAEVYVHMKVVNLQSRLMDADVAVSLGKVGVLEQQLLGYIEVLTEKTKELMKNPAGGKTEEGEDWKSICDIAEDKADKSFDDVVGMAEQKRMAITSFIKPLLFPNVFPALGKGVLLYGPPGTGKTYFVKGMINALQTIDKGVGILYYAPTAADLKGKYVGETEKKIVKYFTCASRNACVRMEESLKEAGGDVRKAKKYISVIFIDEFDGVGGDRSEDQTGLVANSVNTLLQMMDGVQSFKNVTVVAATNYPWNLDAAILRRFNNQIYVGLSNSEDNQELLQLEYKNLIKIKSTNVGCYCAKDIKQSVFKATRDMDAYCGSTITSSDIQLIKDNGPPRIEISLPENVVPLENSGINVTGEETTENHWHITVCVIGTNHRLFKYKFNLSDVPLQKETVNGTTKILAGVINLASPPPVVAKAATELTASTAATARKNNTTRRSSRRSQRGGSKRFKTFKRRRTNVYNEFLTPADDYEVQVGGAKERYKIIINLDDSKDISDLDPSKISSWFMLEDTKVNVRRLEEFSPYKLFKHHFLTAPVLEEVALLMQVQKYSNSDITNVMAYVGQKNGEQVAELGTYINYSLPLLAASGTKSLLSGFQRPTQNPLMGSSSSSTASSSSSTAYSSAAPSSSASRTSSTASVASTSPRVLETPLTPTEQSFLCGSPDEADKQELAKYYVSAASVLKNNSVLQTINKDIQAKIESVLIRGDLSKSLTSLYLTNDKDSMVNVDDIESMSVPDDKKGFVTRFAFEGIKYINTKFVIGNEIAGLFQDPAIKDFFIPEEVTNYSTLAQYKLATGKTSIDVISRIVTNVTSAPDDEGNSLPPNVLLFEIWAATKDVIDYLKELEKTPGGMTFDAQFGLTAPSETMTADKKAEIVDRLNATIDVFNERIAFNEGLLTELRNKTSLEDMAKFNMLHEQTRMLTKDVEEYRVELSTINSATAAITQGGTPSPPSGIRQRNPYVGASGSSSASSSSSASGSSSATNPPNLPLTYERSDVYAYRRNKGAEMFLERINRFFGNNVATAAAGQTEESKARAKIQQLAGMFATKIQLADGVDTTPKTAITDLSTSTVSWLAMLNTLYTNTETLGGNSTINDRVEVPPIVTRSFQMFVRSKIDFSNPWFLHASRSGWGYSGSALLIMGNIQKYLPEFLEKDFNGTKWGAIIGGVAAASILLVTAFPVLAPYLGLTTVATYTGTLPALTLAAGAVGITGMGGLLGGFISSFTRWCATKQIGGNPTDETINKFLNVLATMTVTPGYFLLSHADAVFAKGTGGFDCYKVDTSKLGTGIHWAPAFAYNAFTMFRDAFSTSDAANPNLIALFNLVRKGVATVENLQVRDTPIEILQKIYKSGYRDKDGHTLQTDILAPMNTTSEVKCHKYTNPKVDSSQLVNFSLNPSLLYSGLSKFSSTYNFTNGGWLDQYANDRANFLINRPWKKK